MIRTRDLLLFIVVIFFLGIVVTVTVVHDTRATTRPLQSVTFETTLIEGGAVLTGTTVDPQDTIDRLRTKIANSPEIIIPVSSVEISEIIASDTDNTVDIQKCLYPDDALALVPRWPLKDVQVSVREGARVVYTEEKILLPVISTIDTASSTPVTNKIVITAIPLLQLPLSPQKMTKPICVPSEVVGVTSGGILMFNGDVNSYRKIPEDALIGYARDGFPIYGVYEGEVDQCGGYNHPLGYRYTISTERDYIVGCYVGTPMKFSL